MQKVAQWRYLQSNIIVEIKSRRLRWAGHAVRMREKRKVCKVLLGKPEGKGPLERPRRRWEDGIKMDLTEMGGVGGGCGVYSPGSE
jgi:hypothetical protein